MPPAKRPDKRSPASKSMGSGDDPRYIALARGTSRRAGIPIPDVDDTWQPEVQSWFRSLKLSGQSAFFEASDWATAVAAARAYDMSIRTASPGWFGNFTRLSERLGCTITDRKRSRIELDDPDSQDADEDAADDAVAGWQARLKVVK